MRLFGRSWPKHLERRQPENAEVRRQFDGQLKERAKARAEYAQDVTEENDVRIAQVEAAVRSLTVRLRKGN